MEHATFGGVFLFIFSIVMAFYPHKQGWEVKWFRKIVSTAFVANSLVARSAAIDTVEPGDASDAELVGICLRTVTSADADYASNTRIPVLVPIRKGAEMIGDITNGTIALTDEGNEYDLSTASLVDAGASTNDPVKLLQFISTTRGIFAINLFDMA